jgi:hypothetical protein
MASLRRSKALSPDGQTARFLYTILKQLDLKTIDWNLVADGLDITNGHAARMRFSRFKQHMEGIPAQARNPRSKKDDKDKNVKGKRLKRGLEDDIKGEDIKGLDGVDDKANVKCEPACCIKHEPGMIEESIGTEEPPAVRVKREPKGNQITSAANSRPDYLSLPVRSQEPLPAASLAFATPAAMTTQANAPIASPPPMATVSLADLHLSPNSAPHAPGFGRAAPNFVFAAKPGASWARGDVAASGIKSEPGLMGGAMQAAGCQPLVKSEPTDR